jgi:hypothetical protein
MNSITRTAMKKQSALIVAAIAAVVLAPGIAKASFVLDSGTPTGSGAPVTLSSVQFLAGEFAVTAGDTIVDLSAYLTQGAGQPGDKFTFDIYANSGFTSRSSNRPAAVYSATGTFTANGWNTTAVNWTPTATGDYWLALQVASPSSTRGLDAPLEASSTTGTAPAIAFAYAGNSGQYAMSTAYPIGLEVSDAAPVPLPASFFLLLSGLGAAVGGSVRRRPRAVI